MPKKLWKKGQSGNPNGRPKNPEIEEFRKALKKLKSEGKPDLLEHFVRKAYENDKILAEAVKKILPDKSISEIRGMIGITKVSDVLDKDE